MWNASVSLFKLKLVKVREHSLDFFDPVSSAHGTHKVDDFHARDILWESAVCGQLEDGSPKAIILWG